MNIMIDGIEYAPIRKPLCEMTVGKQLCEVEGKQVYQGDKLWNIPNNFSFIADNVTHYGLWDVHGQGAIFSHVSWNPPKRTVTVEILVEDAERCANQAVYLAGIAEACRKALKGATT